MPVIYDNKKIIPAPYASITKEHLSTDDGQPLSQLYSITLTGKLVAHMGSPNSSGVFWTNSGYPPDENYIIQASGTAQLQSILAKQQGLMSLFNKDGKLLEIQPWNGAAPAKFHTRTKRIEFSEGPWFDTCDYVVSLEADALLCSISGVDLTSSILKATEEWSIDPLDEKQGTYRLTHSLSATGKRTYDEDGQLTQAAWKNAFDYVVGTGTPPSRPADNVLGGLGLVSDRMYATGVLNNFELEAFDHLRTQSINQTAGIFSATETWTCFNPSGEPPAIHDSSVSTRYSSDGGRTTVSVEGTITGLEKRDATNYNTVISKRAANAQSKWLSHVQPKLYATATGVAPSLNVTPLSTTYAKNELAGTITYNWEYDDRSTPTTPGALSELVTINTDNQGDVFAQIPVLGRTKGPVLQDISTKTAKKKTIIVEVQMPATGSYLSSAPNVMTIINALKPTGTTSLFLDQDTETWNPSNGRYSRTASYVWE